jgi:SpoVK/Ycf46/Vps4 family AAA+-type ATPase
LIGIWAREAAARELKVDNSRGVRKDALQDIAEKGDNWAKKGNTVATQLMTLFVNPFELSEDTEQLEPDSQPIGDDQARAAILFGPPGTSKTTISRAVANAIGWDYVELHASHFVAEGLPHVQRTADTIFEKLKQLDRTVILFDEIDELVRAREKEHDAFGRFLTTSMLPKLAELWKRQKVIYFVATNYINFFDPAVTRAQRFDALVHVSPPSFNRKLRRLIKLLENVSVKVRAVKFRRQDVDRAVERAADLQKAKDSERIVALGSYELVRMPQDVVTGNQTTVPLPDALSLARLLLIRWDQLEEVAAAVKESSAGQPKITLSRSLIDKALAKVSDPLLANCASFRDFLDAARYEHHDFRKVSVWKIRGRTPAKWKSQLSTYAGKSFYKSNARFGDFSSFPKGSSIVAPDMVARIG